MIFAAALSEHPVTATAVGECAGAVLESVGPGASLVTVFVTPHHAGALEDVGRALRAILQPAVLVGGAAAAVVGDGRLVSGPALTVWAGRGLDVAPVRLGPGLHPSGPDPPERDDGSTVIVAVDPFTTTPDELLDAVAASAPGAGVVGGNLSAARGPGGNRLLLDDRVYTDGAVGARIGDRAIPVVSSGGRPVGQPFVVTRAERSVIYELGGQPAYHRLMTLADDTLPAIDRSLLGRAVLLGVVMDEYREDYGPGDFVLRTVTGADTGAGAIAVDVPVDVGSTAQFHVRDADSATDELHHLLAGLDVAAGLLFADIDRPQALRTSPDHDAVTVAEMLDRPPLSGFAAAGGYGPVGGRNLAHRTTLGMALFPDRGRGARR